MGAKSSSDDCHTKVCQLPFSSVPFVARLVSGSGANPMQTVELFENRDYRGSTHFFFDIGNSNLIAFFDFPGLGLQPGVESIGAVQHIAILTQKLIGHDGPTKPGPENDDMRHDLSSLWMPA